MRQRNDKKMTVGEGIPLQERPRNLHSPCNGVVIWVIYSSAVFQPNQDESEQ